MPKEIRFGALVREISVRQRGITYREVIDRQLQSSVQDSTANQAAKIQLRSIDVYRLLLPYIGTRFYDQVKAVVPLSLYLTLFQIFVLNQQVSDAGIIGAGLGAVILGLMLFMEGLKVGLMPLGQALGTTLPAKAHLSVVLLIGFLLGIGVTFAEPAIGALKAAGQIVQVDSAPYLYALLNIWTEYLVMGIGIGVGAAAILGTLRFLYGWSLKPLIYITLIPLLALTTYMLGDPELRKVLGLAWDCGAVTTGPVTVPLVLSLGIGIAAAAGKGQSSLSGFGIVTLASLFPIISVELLAIYVAWVSTPEAIIQMASSADTVATTLSWSQQTPWQELVGGVRAILPLVLFLMLVMRWVLQEPIKNRDQIIFGITLAVVGMIIFNLGLTYGLTKLGAQAGSLVPASFSDIAEVENDPIYSFGFGLAIAVLFAWLLGFGATLAEPALNALGMTVENLTNGTLRKSTLMHAVSLGVGFGISLGVLKIVFGWSLAWLLIPSYLAAVVLTHFSTEEFVNIAWDSAGVTTGPVTVPLVLALGLGFGNAMQAVEGFGILAMASICPILAVLMTGLWLQWSERRNTRLAQAKDAGQDE